jgi:hypothetical protein
MRPNALRLAQLGIAASTAAIGAGAIYLARDRIFSHKTTANDTSPTNPALVPRHSTDPAAQRAARIADRFRRLWPEVTGRSGPMPEAALEIALSQAWLESGIAEAGGGGWWKDKSDTGQGDMRGSGNLGSRHCGAGDTGGDYYKCVPYGDTVPQADGTNKPYDVSFRYYTGGNCGGKQRDAADCAAWDFLYDITRRWPGLPELEAGDLLGYAMKLGPKYRADDPPNQTVFGRPYAGGTGYYGGFGKSMQKRVGGYAYALASHLPAVAAALGHPRIFAKVPAEVLTYSDKDDAIRLAGAAELVSIEGVGTVLAVIAGAVVVLIGVGLATTATAEAQATQFLGGLRTAGFDLVEPGQTARAGWRSIDLADPGLARAAKGTTAKGDQMLRALAAHGYTFQTRRPGRIKLQIPKKPGTAASSAPYDAAANWTAAAQTALEKCLAKPGSDLITCAQDPSVINATKNPAAAAAEAAKLAAKPGTPALEQDRIPLPGNPTAAPSTPALEQDRDPVRLAQEELRYERINPDGTTAPIQGEADVTAEQARASDAYAVAQTAQLEGVGRIAAIAAAGLVAGGVVGAAVHFATRPSDASAAAPATAATPPATPAPAPSSPAPHPTAAPAPRPAAAPAKAKPVTPAPEPEEDPGFQVSDLLPGGGDEVTVTKNKRTKKIAGADDDDAGEVLRALHLCGALPRARALPVTGELFWFLEEPDQAGLAGLDEKLAFLDVEEQDADEAAAVDLGTAAERNPFCQCVGCSYMEPHVHAFCPEGQGPRSTESEADLGAAPPRKDSIDNTLDTASDVATVASSILAAGGAIKKIADRTQIDPDPKCRAMLREWVERHPWLHRIGMLRGGPDLTALAGDESGQSPTDRYLDALMELRGADDDQPCAISPEEDRAVLVHLGATPQEIDAIYNVASRSGAMVADLFAPGVGRGITATADAIRASVDPTMQARRPPKESAEKKPSAAAACQAELADERARLMVVTAAHDRHPHVAKLFGFPDPRKIGQVPKLAGNDPEPAAPTTEKE